MRCEREPETESDTSGRKEGITLKNDVHNNDNQQPCVLVLPSFAEQVRYSMFPTHVNEKPSPLKLIVCVCPKTLVAFHIKILVAGAKSGLDSNLTWP